MYRLELDIWDGIKCMGWNETYGLELNLRDGIKCTGWK